MLKIRVIHTIKYDGDNKFSKCKCRAVIRGFASDYQGQRHSPTVQRISVHIISAMSARLNLIMHTCDIVSAYLLATLLVPQYVEIPKEFRIISPESFTDTMMTVLYWKRLYMDCQRRAEDSIRHMRH